MATIAGLIRGKTLRHRLTENASFYAQKLTRAEQLDLQLEMLNRRWAGIVTKVPWYSELFAEGIVPRVFRCWDEYLDVIPVLTKRQLQEDADKLTDTSRPPDMTRVTGGTTAEPIQVPAWHSELRDIEVDTWTARSWYGIKPSSRLFLLWGHSHLLGTGWRGKAKSCLRQAKDRMLGYYRFSAYDMTAEKMREAAHQILVFRPHYVIGYSVALDALARTNLDLADRIRDVGIRVVLGAAEAFPRSDSEELIRRVFGCPVGMEYGSVETNLMAHTLPAGYYQVFWRNYFLEATDMASNGGRVLRVTSLYPRCFPLFRYEIGDEVELFDGDSGVGLSRFTSITGRCNLFVSLPDGTRIHSEAFTHCFREHREIHQYQVVQTNDRIQARIVLWAECHSTMMAEIRAKLKRIHPGLERIELKIVDRLEQTRAGKTPMILRKNQADSSLTGECQQ